MRFAPLEDLREYTVSGDSKVDPKVEPQVPLGRDPACEPVNFDSDRAGEDPPGLDCIGEGEVLV